MSEDQAVSAPAVDVAAIRAALERASRRNQELWSTFESVNGTPHIEAVYSDGSRDMVARVYAPDNAELIVLLRNNAEALLRMVDDGYCVGYDHGVEDQMDRQARMEPGRWWRAIDTDGGVWCESSSEDEVREMARPSDRVQRLYTSTAGEWRDQPGEVSP